jgi:Zn-dependent protease with chaperone function
MTSATETVETHYARYSDGRSAGARDATVRCTGAGIEIAIANSAQRHLWKYASLATSEPIRAHSVDVLLSSSDMPGASVFVPAPEFASDLSRRVPRLSARRARWRNARPWVIVALALCAFVVSAMAAGWSPLRSLALMLPDSWRQRLGEQAISSMTEGYKKCSEPNGVAAMEAMAKRLATGSGHTGPFKVVVYDWSLMNAFAVPGEQIVVTKGLIDKAESPDEVAGVLAHEMGHGIKLHPETGIIRAIGLAAAVELMLGGSSGALANAGLMLAQLGYTRASEREADQQGLELLRAASISPNGLAAFFKRVEDMERDDGGLDAAVKGINILRSHPPTEERAKLVAAQAPYASTPALDDKSWRDLRGICQTTAAP